MAPYRGSHLERVPLRQGDTETGIPQREERGRCITEGSCLESGMHDKGILFREGVHYKGSVLREGGISQEIPAEGHII